MSFAELIDTSKSIALSNKLNPDEVAYYNLICREYSKTFHTPLDRVLELDPQFVCQMYFEEQLSHWDKHDQLEEIVDLIESLKNPEYDIEKERKLREELRKMEMEEEERLRDGRAVHESLEPKNDIKIEENLTKEKDLPKSGGLNMALLNQLANDESQSGEF